jgi:AcrR family transcriptional regulator
VVPVDKRPPFPRPKLPDPSAKERILAAALGCFAVDGLAATSLGAVAARAGASTGLVQHHFGTKAGLVTAVNEHVLRVAADAIASQPLPAPPADTLAELGRRVTSIMTDNPDVVDYLARGFLDGDELAVTIFDGLVAISTDQWNQLAEHHLLQPGIDRTWAALHPLILVLGTVVLRKQIDRHLPEPLATPTQLRRWDNAVAQLLRSGLLTG